MKNIKYLALCTFALLLESQREMQSVRVKKIRIDCAPCKGRLVFVTDLHGREHLDDILEKIRNLSPDAILSGGDLLTASDFRSHEKAKTFIRNLIQIAPVYAGNGNHEMRMKGYDTYTSFLRQNSVTVLSNTSAVVPLKSGDVCVSGIDIPQGYYRLFERNTVDPNFIKEKIGTLNPNRYNIVMAHNPAHFDACASCGADILLGGHMHGGIISLPGGRGLISPQAKIFPRYAWGYRKKDQTHMITSRGLGSHTVNFRLFNSPEIIVIDLHN